PSAIALNSALNNLARMLAPALAGVLIAVVGGGFIGEATCFLLNGVSYGAVLIALALMSVPTVPRPPADRSWLGPLKEGFRYAYHCVAVRDVLVLAGIIGMVGTPGTLLPVFARQLGAGNARTLGFLLGATGAGALVGALFVATRPAVVGA